ncbi:hypothetical protein CONCODRAFT_82701 [Conidiobolus coronatus NRRL 28638]|uniref:Uncharacterized protein n=1 Tax=Conidiobolus coronatus (strain ATCC 28846 / CBS 209.66 / NRRL 28638) TaxID=796925 RepID=A0A137PID9_CONC2|nr:hypothetical protein CONCODRAFT_82701 [Conidiobolus coronatus NRRL 28638]|eukprot:KXN74766.1 hypothetical protein CONCODRAFT_82701 [Conidiobolus coronatus NRRL 28638]
MSTSNLSYNEFIQTIEGGDDFDSIAKMAYVSQMRRRGSDASIHSQCSIASSVCSTASTKSAVPSATDLDTALYQKGFELRQCDSEEEFDIILEQGFRGSVGESMKTLKLTLTPGLLRQK